jgi:hypothetical protein
MDVLEDENRYTWMKDCLLGKSAFTVNELYSYSLVSRLVPSKNPDFSFRQYICGGPLADPTNDDEDWA